MLDILARWNRWGNATLNAGIARDITPQLSAFLNTSDIVVLIGPRRAGKTTVLFQIMDILEQADVPPEAMLHLNLEEPALSPKLSIELLDQVYDTYRTHIYPEKKAYLFLDEIQNVPHWEQWVRARNETENIKLFITGSSSRLMSRELGTLLTGRHVSFKVFPLSFKEFLRFRSISITSKKKWITATPQLKHALKDYLTWGGFPEVVLAKDQLRKEVLLKQYFDDVLFKDIVVRHNIRDAITLKNIAIFLLTQTASLVSAQRISKIFGVSLDLAKSYCQYIQEAFLVDFIPFYSLKIAERHRNPQKTHAIDLGLRNVVSLTPSEDKGRLIETVVYNALRLIPNDGIFYWKHEGEIDLLLRNKNVITALFQIVSDGLERAEVQKREYHAFEKARAVFKKAKKIIIAANGPSSTWNLPKDINGISLLQFLLGGED